MSAIKRTVKRARNAPRRTEPNNKDSKRPVKHRVMVVDDHPMTREGLVAIINRQPDLEVCCQESCPAAAMSELSNSKPDLIVTDLSMPGRGGIEFLKDVHAMLPEIPVLVLSMHDESLYTERVLRAGARGYLMKIAGAAKVLEVIRLLLGGQIYVSPKMSERLLELVTGRRPRGSVSPIEKLSDREFEVFRMLGGGMCTKEVADALNLSPKTVDVHRARIKEKLHIKDATSLVYFAIRWVESQAARP